MSAPEVTVRREPWYIAGVGFEPRWVIRWTDVEGHTHALPRRTHDNAIRLIAHTQRKAQRRRRTS